MTTLNIHRSDDRFNTRTSWLDSWHSFSFSQHYDPKNTRHGLLVVLNDDIVQPHKGFGWHPHQDMEIVTWVLEGELEHGDSMGERGIMVPGLAQRMTAGTGIYHQELNPSATRPVHFVQMWVLPDERDLEPEYEQRELTEALASGGLVAVASGRGHAGALRIHQRDAVLWVGRLSAGERITVPAAPYVHCYVARGDGLLADHHQLLAGDAARLVNSKELDFHAGSAGAEVLIWEMARGAA